MKYERFEDLPVWKDSAKLSAKIFIMTEDKSFRFKGDIANQIQRASLSISNNIAEGFERGTTQELITFLYYARGSAGEVRSILAVMELMPYFDNLKSQISDLKSKAESISRQIRGWADSLQNTEITGQRYLNNQTKKGYENKKSKEKFLEELKQYSYKPKS
ncbi:MAG: S23 ribosomal protein [uncultured bacterium]|nr:MAG: S23 ribosomal protein [uncultured bacterium]